jgi:histone deacetylase complex regulatory component SIN3
LYPTSKEKHIMATPTTIMKSNDFTEGFGDAAERYRAINEKLAETGKKTASAALDGYEKTITSYVDFRQQLADFTQLDWVSTVVKAQNDFLSEVSAAYISAARDLLKGYNEDEPPARVVEKPSGDDIDSHAADRAAGYEDELEDDEDLEDDDTNQESEESDVQEDVHNEPAEDADVEEEPEKDTNGDDESEVTDLKPRNQRPRGPRKAPALRKPPTPRPPQS